MYALGDVKPQLREDEQDDEAEARLPDPAVHASYRVSGNLQVRAAELEQELAETKQELRTMEREVYAARAKLRKQTALRGTNVGGIGALLGAIVGTVGYGMTDKPGFIVGAMVLGFVLAFLGSAQWRPPDDQFPDAPPPRTF